MNKDKNKSKRKAISLETKTIILKRLAEGEGSTALGKEFGLGESTIRGIQKRAGEINKSINCATNESAKRASYSRNNLMEKMEQALILWIQELTQKGIPINGKLIKEKAIYFYNQLKDLEPSCSSSHPRSTKFSASNGWLVGFLKRHALNNLKINDAAASADDTATENYPKVLEKSIEDGACCPDQVFNADETELFLKKMPSRTDRVTFLLCSNVSEARMLKPLLINRTLHCIENDLVERDETVRNDDIINYVTDVTDCQKEPDYMTADKIYAGLQLCYKLECHFLAIDANSERTSKFQKELQSCISGYRDIYKRLVKKKSSQRLITDYMVIEKKSNRNECKVESSSDESDFEPVYHKKVRVLSDYDR